MNQFPTVDSNDEDTIIVIVNFNRTVNTILLHIKHPKFSFPEVVIYCFIETNLPLLKMSLDSLEFIRRFLEYTQGQMKACI